MDTVTPQTATAESPESPGADAAENIGGDGPRMVVAACSNEGSVVQLRLYDPETSEVTGEREFRVPDGWRLINQECEAGAFNVGRGSWRLAMRFSPDWQRMAIDGSNDGTSKLVGWVDEAGEHHIESAVDTGDFSSPIKESGAAFDHFGDGDLFFVRESDGERESGIFRVSLDGDPEKLEDVEYSHGAPGAPAPLHGVNGDWLSYGGISPNGKYTWDHDVMNGKYTVRKIGGSSGKSPKELLLSDDRSCDVMIMWYGRYDMLCQDFDRSQFYALGFGTSLSNVGLATALLPRNTRRNDDGYVSPDGEQLAFVSSAATGAARSAYVTPMAPDGDPEDPRKIVDLGSGEFLVGWQK